MSYSTYNIDPEKSFNVVFERQTPMSDEETQSDILILDTRAKSMIKDFTKQELRRRIEELHKGHQETKHSEESKFYRLLETVGNSTAEENRATETFVSNVEQMMNINKDIGKLQDTYKNIMDKLSKS